MKRFASMLLLICLLVCTGMICSSCGNSASDQNSGRLDAQKNEQAPYGTQTTDLFEGPGYETPEAAFDAYIGYWNAGDTAGMMSVYAIEHYVDHLNTEEILRQRQVYYPDLLAGSQVMSAVSGMREIEVYGRFANISRQMRRRYLVIHWSEPINGYENPVSSGFWTYIIDQGQLDAYASIIDVFNEQGPDKIQRISYLDVDELTNGKYTEYILSQRDPQKYDDIRSGREKQASCLGADDVIDLAALLKINDQWYIMTMQFARWDGKWYAVTAQGDLAAILTLDTTYAGLIPASEMNID